MGSCKTDHGVWVHVKQTTGYGCMPNGPGCCTGSPWVVCVGNGPSSEDVELLVSSELPAIKARESARSCILVSLLDMLIFGYAPAPELGQTRVLYKPG